MIGVSSGQSFLRTSNVHFITPIHRRLYYGPDRIAVSCDSEGHEVRELHIEVREFTDKNAQQLDLFPVKV